MKHDVKVAQLAGYISEHAGYHHGEMSLVSTIVGMAQDFVGSNNVNLLFPSGQFGTRAMGGKDAASARYIYTRLSEVTRFIYHPHDDHILDYLEDDGSKIEPRYYVPIIPMILVNGADGIGTGWSTSIPNFNPRDIIANIRKYIKGEPMTPMQPWYRGFTGNIEVNDKNGYDFVGRVQQTGRGYVEMTELPIRKWTLDYKEFLQEMLPQAKKDARDEGITIEDIKEYHTENTVHFVCKMSERALSCALDAGLDRAFKIRTSRSLDNMFCFNSESKIQKYDSALNVLEEFCALRVLFYDRRKQYLLGKLSIEKLILENQVRFLQQVCKGKMKVAKKKKTALINELNSKKFQTMEKIQKLGKTIRNTGRGSIQREASDDADVLVPAKSGFDYILGMPLWSLTAERLADLESKLDGKIKELNTLEKTRIESLWERDIDALCEQLTKIDEIAKKVEGQALISKQKMIKGKKGVLFGTGKRAGVFTTLERSAKKSKQGSSSNDLSDDEPKKPSTKRKGSVLGKGSYKKRKSKSVDSDSEDDAESDQ